MTARTTGPASPTRRRLLLGGSLAAAVTGIDLVSRPASAAPGTTAWLLGGNTDVTTTGSNFLGTRNVAPLVFKTAAIDATPTERMRITPTGQVGIGTKTPVTRLDVRTNGGTGIRGVTRGAGNGVIGQSSHPDGTGIRGLHTATTGTTPGVLGQTDSTADNATAVHGVVTPAAPGSASAGVLGTNNGTGGWGMGVWGVHAGNGIGVLGQAQTGTGVQGSSHWTGVYGYAGASGGVGVNGNAPNGTGVRAHGSTFGVAASSYAGTGVRATGIGNGVHASGQIGVLGDGASNSGAGCYGTGWVGVQGVATGATDSQGVRGEDGGSGTRWAGVFMGKVGVFGTLSKSAGSFVIDHPLDPENKTLSHSFVESPDMKNVYDGVVTLDDHGRAEVTLPAYFEALNRDYRYQLTCLGAHAPVYIARKITDSSFEIAGGTAGLEVSWQVTGIRQDAYAKAHPIIVEQDKDRRDRGRYLTPEAHGAGPERGVLAVRPAADPGDPPPPMPAAERPHQP